MWLVERAQTDFGVAMARLLLVAAWQSEPGYAALASSDETLAAVGAKAVKEVAYHLDHATSWVVRLGDGTEVSHERMQAALDAEWPTSTSCSVRSRGRGGPRVAPCQGARPGHPGGRRGDAGRARGDAGARWRTPGPAHRGDGLPAGRDAAPAPVAGVSW